MTKPKEYPQPDIPICSECGEHAEFDENGSTCCGAGSPNPDPDMDMERYANSADRFEPSHFNPEAL